MHGGSQSASSGILRKMKVALVVCAILGLATAIPHHPRSTKDLQGDLQDIVSLIPVEEIRAIARRYLETDAEFQQIVSYLQGDEWANLVGAVRDHPSWMEFKSFMEEAGVDIEGVIQWIHDLIAGAQVPMKTGKDVRGIREFLDEVLAILPLDDLLATLSDKLANSADFQMFFEKISSDEARAMVEEIRALEEVQRIAQVLRDMGVDVDKVIDFIFDLLGWARKSRDLQSDLQDIVSLIPVEEIRAIARRYLETDAEFQQIVRYLQGDEWATLVGAVRDHPSWMEFKSFMEEAGVDIEGVIQWIHDLIAGAEVPVKTGKDARGIREFLDEVLAILPLDDLLATLSDKLANSADFQMFFEKISSDEARAMVEEIRALEEVQRIAQVLRDMGVDVDKVIDFIFDLLGWARKSRDLQSDLQDIVSLIPVEEIRAIARRYLETDAEFQQIVRYLQGDEWATLVGAVRDHPSWMEFKSFMEEAGVDIEGVIQWIHDLIAGAEVPVKTGKDARGIREFLDEVLAILPLDDLLATLSDKLANSADFQMFFEKISSDEARAMVEEIRALEEVQRIAQVLRDMGVDVDKVIDFIFDLLGWTRKSRDLQSDLQDIVSLIPVEEIRAIARRYLETDAEFQQIVRYLQGDEWANLVGAVRDHPSWMEFKSFMEEAGVDIEGVIQWIHDLIAGAEVPAKTGKDARGIREFLDEVLAILPLDDLLATLSDKLANSADFQTFFEKISSDEARAMVEEIRALEEVQRIAQVLRDMGVDVDKVIDFIFDLLGWTRMV